MQPWLLGPLRARLLDELAGTQEDGLDLRVARRIVEEDLARGATRSRLLYGLLAYRAWVGRLRTVRTERARLADRAPSIAPVARPREAQ